jgi:AcrR family transcriptional regulator
MASTAPKPDLPPQRGRPRDPARDESILDAAIALIADVGYDRTTVDAIAERAGVGKPTIYRRWAGKPELVAEAIRRRKARRPVEDTGSLRGDLLAAINSLCHSIDDESAHLAAGMATQLRASEELAALFSEHVIAVERARWAQIVQRATERGELRAGEPVSPLFGEIGPSTVFSRVLLGIEPVDDVFVEELVDRILLPILPRTTSQDHQSS